VRLSVDPFFLKQILEISASFSFCQLVTCGWAKGHRTTHALVLTRNVFHVPATYFLSGLHFLAVRVYSTLAFASVVYPASHPDVTLVDHSFARKRGCDLRRFRARFMHARWTPRRFFPSALDDRVCACSGHSHVIFFAISY
jgi:hypothetical protein